MRRPKFLSRSSPEPAPEPEGPVVPDEAISESTSPPEVEGLETWSHERRGSEYTEGADFCGSIRLTDSDRSDVLVKMRVW